MTVASTQNRKTFAGNGVTTSFGTSPVVFFDTADLDVYVVTTATGASELLTENTDYTVSGGSGSTGTVSLAGGSDPYGAPASGQTLVIVRTLDLVQEVDFVNNEATDAEVTEDALDKLTMMTQQLSQRLARAFILADSDVTGASTELPTPEASKLLGWNEDGDALQNYSSEDLDTALLPLSVANGGTGRTTSTTAYGLLAAGTTATGAHQTLAAGATTEILVGGGTGALPVWTTATGTGAPVRAGAPTFTGTATFASAVMPSQPAFLAYAGSTVSNVSGAGATYNVGFDTEVFDQASNFASSAFTAPISGRYRFSASVYVTGLASATSLSLLLITSNRSYQLFYANGSFSNDFVLTGSTLADMDANDTATVRVIIGGMAGDTADAFGTASPLCTYFSGELVC